MTTGLFTAKTVAVPLLIIFMENEKDAIIADRELLNGTHKKIKAVRMISQEGKQLGGVPITIPSPDSTRATSSG